jgi:hypothetical protein
MQAVEMQESRKKIKAHTWEMGTGFLPWRGVA